MNRMELSRLVIRAGLMAALALVVACAPSAANVTVSGHVRDVYAIGMSGVTVRASGGTAAATGADGSYSLSLASGWSGMVGPEGLYMFQPTSYTYTAITTDQPNQDFMASPQQFEHRSTSINNISRGTVAWGDFDNNGIMDIAVAGYEFDQRHGTLAPGTRIWRNDGAANFTAVSASFTGVQDAALAWGDYDNDGKLDLIVAGDTGATYVTKLYHNSVTTWPVNTAAVLPGIAKGSVAWGDYDSDGYPDLLMAGNSASGRITKLFHNNTNGTFTEAAGVALPGLSDCSVAWSDYDGDGRLDFAIAGSTDSGPITRIYHNDGGGVFSDIAAGLTGVAYASLAWGDYDNDGKPDLAFAGVRADSVTITRICRNTGTTFLEQDLGIPGVKGSIAWGDYGNDGKLDLGIVGAQGSSNTPKACRNNGDGTFTIYPVTVADVGLINTSLAWGDYDNDGKLDLMVSGDTNNGYPGTFLYQNTTTKAVIGAPSTYSTHSGPVTYTITYVDATTVTLANGHITLNKTGTANGTVAVSGTGTATRTVTISGITGDGTLGISIAAGTATDNNGCIAPAAGPSATFMVNSLPPTISIGAPSTSLTNVGPVSCTVTYGSAYAVTLASGNVTLNKTGTANGTVAVGGTGNTTRTVTISGITGSGTLGISIAAATASNGSGTAPAAGPSDVFTVVNIPPTISIGAPSASLTNVGPVTYTVTYGGASTVTLANGNVTLNKTATANGTVAVSGTGTTIRTVTISGITGDGTLGISIAAATATNLAGDPAPAAGPSGVFSVDNTPPTVSVGAPSGSLPRGGPISYTITYGAADAVTLAGEHVTLNKTGTANGTVAVTGTGLTTRTVTVSDITGDGTLGISIAAATASDNAGNTAAATGPSATFAADNTGPAVTVGAPSASVTAAGPVTYEITYADAASISLTAIDVSLNKTGTADGTVAITGTGLTTRTVTVSDITGDGMLGISLAAGTAADSLGNMALTAGPSETFTVDNSGPTISIGAPSESITKAGPITYEITYEGADAVTLANSDVTLNHTDTANGTVAVTGTGPDTRTVTISDITGDGTLGISIAAGTASDGSNNTAPAAGPSDTFTVDNTAPTAVALSLNRTITNGADVIASFSGSTDTNGVTYQLKVDGGEYATATSPSSVVLTQLNDGIHVVYVRAVDPAGNASAEASTPFTYDKTAPLILSVTYSPKLLAAGDPISITVTAADSFGVTAVTVNGIAFTNSSDDLWTGTLTADQTIGPHEVAVVAHDAAGNSTPYDSQYATAPSVGLNNRSTADQIMIAACGSFVFTVWGRVTVTPGDPDSFFIDDGSGRLIRVLFAAHGLTDNDYASARGTLDVSANPPVLTAHVVKKQN